MLVDGSAPHQDYVIRLNAECGHAFLFSAFVHCPQIERLTFVPKKAMITEVYFTVLDRDTASLMNRGKSMLLTTNRTAAEGETASMLVIGDS
jgi:hypothetical protein